MKIEKLTITTEELCIAVSEFLKTKGVSVVVDGVEKNYSRPGYTVEIREEPEPAPAPNEKPE